MIKLHKEARERETEERNTLSEKFLKYAVDCGLVNLRKLIPRNKSLWEWTHGGVHVHSTSDCPSTYKFTQCVICLPLMVAI